MTTSNQETNKSLGREGFTNPEEQPQQYAAGSEAENLDTDEETEDGEDLDEEDLDDEESLADFGNGSDGGSSSDGDS